MQKLLAAFVAFIMSIQLFSQTFSEKYFSNMRWRMIGPRRAGRTVGVVGEPQQPNVF
ncbi:MAG TPA: hypothetical protein VFZ33_10475 [Chitinophagaceae bacterium]